MIDIHIYSGRMGNEMFRHAYLYAQEREGVIPDTYLQDPKYFEKYGDEIKQLFGEGIGYLPYVGVHLRVGANPLDPNELNYIDNPFYVPLAKTGYYIDAIAQFPNRKFIVFSDNMEFAKTYFEGDKFSFDDSETDLESFNKLASCDGQIIANSSWSWWAAYLSPNKGKVVAPSKEHWYNDGIERTVCPTQWLRL